MEVFGVGPLELLVILVILLIVVGPRRLPEMAVELAHMLRTVRKFGTQISQELTETMSDLEKEYADIKGDWKDVGQGLSETTKPVSTGLEAAARDATAALEEAKEPSERAPAS
ncbi:MAG: twin-arginine translocase TatA/TatE family subunit [Dehalococcoidia bacterium]